MFNKKIHYILLILFLAVLSINFGTTNIFGDDPEDSSMAGEGSEIVSALENTAGEGETKEVLAEYDFSRAVISDEVLSYTGSETTKESVTVYGIVTANGETAEVQLAEGTDYVIDYANNINAGTAAITVSGIGNYAGKTLKETFDIEKAEIESIEIPEDTFVYTGALIEPAVEVYAVLGNESVLLDSLSDYDLCYTDNVDAGDAEITVTGKGNFTGTLTRTFFIAPATVTSVTPGYKFMTYTGEARTQTEATAVSCGDRILTNGIDYDISYENNIRIGTAVMTVTGKGNYTGTITKKFAIKGELVSADLKFSSLKYNGTARKQNGSVLVKGNNNGKKVTLKYGTDFKVAYADNTNVGTATMTITGKGRYTGTLTRTFSIVPAAITSVQLKYNTLTYNGRARTQTGSTVVKCGNNILTNGADYTVSYRDNTRIGTAVMTVTGKGNYKGTVNRKFAIKGELISAELKYDSLKYNGKARKQNGSVIVKGNNNGKTVTLTRGNDYKISYKNNTDVGTATMTITGKGNYTGKLTKTYKIKAAALKDAVLPKDTIIYTGKEIKPVPTVTAKVDGKAVTLTKGTDYTVSYKNNKDLGTATATVSGIGNYEGKLEKTFRIVRIKVSGSGTSRTVTVSSAYKKYRQLTAAVWSDSNGGDDKTWYTMGKNSKGNWTAKVDFINFKGSGTATAHIYAGSKYVCEISFTIPHGEWLTAHSERFKAEFLKGTNSFANIDYIQCAISIAKNNYYGYDHTWRDNRHTMSCAGLVNLCLTYCGYGDFIKDDPPEQLDGRRWGYLDLGTYSIKKYDWREIMEKEVGAVWHIGTAGIQPGDVLYYDIDLERNHTGFYLGNNATVESRGPATNFSYNDDSGAEIATFSNGLNEFPWEGYYRIPNKNKAW